MKVVALYLPAYHRIPENDANWGEGFTEWTHLQNWRPLFGGHTIQHPHQDIGQYDLLDVDVRRRQAVMAKTYGVHGFGVYHYWFNRKLLLQQPYERMLTDGEPDQPFCFIWANEPWSRNWDGHADHILQPQSYGGEDEWRDHVAYLMPFWTHRNAIKIDGRPLFVIYRAGTVTDVDKRVNFYREHSGLNLFVTTLSGTFPKEQIPGHYPSLDGGIEFAPFAKTNGWPANYPLLPHQRLFHGISPGFDNSPRRKERSGRIMQASLTEQLERLHDADMVFVNAWNEWGEQAVIEPSQERGYRMLEQIAAFSRP